ncbi:unnamed protein product [Oreochromis niloticus]|nr:unnamed protein product [Mustela putorius furo]
MGPADSRTVSQEELLAQLWSYCRSILQGADPHQRHLQVVFFDSFLSSTTLSVSFLDTKRLISIITMLRASSCFELFGFGCPGEEDVATSLEALAAYLFFHRQIASPPSFAAHLLDPPLREKQFTRPLHLTTSPLTSAASAESADKGPAAQNHTAALLSGRLVEPQPVAPAPASSKKRRLRRPSPPPDSLTFPQPIVVSHMDNSSSLTSSVYSLDCVNANLVAQPVALAQPVAAAQHVTQSAAQHVTQSAAQLVTQSAAQHVTQSAAQLVTQSAAQHVTQSAAQLVTQSAAQLVTQSAAQSASHLYPQLEVDRPAGPTLPSFHPAVVPASLSSLP